MALKASTFSLRGDSDSGTDLMAETELTVARWGLKGFFSFLEQICYLSFKLPKALFGDLRCLTRWCDDFTS